MIDRLACVPLLVGCIVTRPPKTEDRPRWYITSDAGLDRDCVSARAMIRKSGKQGVGVSLQLRSRTDCTVSIDSVKLELAKSTTAVPAIAPLSLRGRSLVYAWLPVPFDNNAAWNDEHNNAAIHLELKIAGKPVTWTISMEQRAVTAGNSRRLR